MPRVVPPGWGTWALLGFVLFFSLAEMPLMIYVLRRMVGSDAARSTATVMVVATSAFVFFAAFYAAPFTVLTGQVAIGAALAGLSVVRLVGVLVLVPGLEE